MSMIMSTIRGRAATPLSATASPTTVYGSVVSAGVATTDPTTATPTGGTPGYTYSWEYVSGIAATVNSPSSATTTFSRNMVTPGSFQTGVYRCRVTDSDTNEVFTNNVTVETEYVV